jgi:hypothetical protein
MPVAVVANAANHATRAIPLDQVATALSRAVKP